MRNVLKEKNEKCVICYGAIFLALNLFKFQMRKT